MFSLTFLPRLRLAVPGLLILALGVAAPAQESRTPFAQSGRTPPMNGSEELLDELFASPTLAALSQEATQPLTPGPPAPVFRALDDGTTVVTIHWDTNDGKSIERRSAELLVTMVQSPEPTPMFFGGCAGCVLLLRRKRAAPGKLRFACGGTSGRSRARDRAARTRSAGWDRAPGIRPRPRREIPLRNHVTAVGRLSPRAPRLGLH